MRNRESEGFYKNIYVDGVCHKISSILYDADSKEVRYLIGSFYTRQMLDQCLAQFQKGTSISYEGIHLWTKQKSYIGKVAKASNENTCDGVHAVFYNNEDRVIRIFNDENEVEKIYDWLIDHVQSGLIPEWKSYFFNELKKQDLIHKCIGFDSTNKAPKVVIMDSKIDTELIRNIKAQGLKSGQIVLPVKNNRIIQKDMSFLDIIQKLIIPYIGEQKCEYNVGEKISPIFSSPIESEGNTYTLFPKQQIIAQGFLNTIKNNNPYILFNGGTGIGKTYTSIKLSWAIIQEVFKLKGKGKILLLCQGHLCKKWERQINECLNPLGVKPNFIIVNNFKDIYKIPKKSSGLDVIIMAKDKVKRTYLLEHFAVQKHKSYSEIINKTYDLTNKVKRENMSSIIIAEASDITSMKCVAVRLEKVLRKKVVLYTPYRNNEGDISGYYVTSTSDTLNRLFGNTHKAYNFKVTSINLLKKAINKNKTEILNESVTSIGSKIINPLVCPSCGAIVYEKVDQVFDEEKEDQYLCVRAEKPKKSIIKCNAYIKADGTTLTDYEIELIKNGKVSYKVVQGKYKFAYQDEDGEFITGEALQKVKNNPIGVTILLKICGEKLFGSKNQKGYRCISATKFLLKILGKKKIDVSIVDEAHLFALNSNQGEAFADVCRASKVVLPLTGTLTGGKASDLFRLLFRLCPRKMVELGYNFNDESLFIDHYGRKKQTTITYDENYNKSGTKVSKSGWQEIPGISPMLYNIFLVNHMVSRKIEDMNIPLPQIKYFKHDIDMSSELKLNYFSLKDDFLRFIKNNRDVSLGGSYINGLLSYPDMPQQKPIYTKLCGHKILVANPKVMDIKNTLLPKESKLVKTIRRELAEGRRCLVYATFTGEKGVGRRLIDILSRYFRTSELKGEKIKVENREEWIEKEYKKGTEVIVTNPECVSTGLDIIQYPTIYFYEIPLNTKTLRQSEKRGYRPSQKKECRIYYSYYKGSIQEDLILLQALKKKSSLSLEGVFSEDMLSAMAEGGDSIEAMLNKVLEGKLKLKESELNNFNFESENDTLIDIKDTSEMNSRNDFLEKSIKFSIFTVDKKYKEKLKGKKRKNTIEGQMGFAI